LKTQVAERAPRKGKRVTAKKKRKLEKEAEAEDSKKKRGRQEKGTIVKAGAMAEAEEALGEPEAPNGERGAKVATYVQLSSRLRLSDYGDLEPPGL
jgi:hypothetical protein